MTIFQSLAAVNLDNFRVLHVEVYLHFIHARREWCTKSRHVLTDFKTSNLKLMDHVLIQRI